MSLSKHFKKISAVEEYTIHKYKDMLLEDLIEAWKTNGYGTFMNGYLKLINPDEFSSFSKWLLFKERRNNTYFQYIDG